MSDADIEFSLADFADIDVSGIEEVRFIDLPAGIFEFRCKEASLSEGEKDGVKRFNVSFVHEITDVKVCLDKSIDPDSLPGKTFEQKFFVVPSDGDEEFRKAVGRIRAHITDIGGNSDGKLAVIVADSKGIDFKGQLFKVRSKTDPTQFFTRLKLEPKGK